MPPIVAIISLGGILMLLSGFTWLMFRMGGFRLTPRERRNWLVTAAILLVWILFLALAGPLPPIAVLGLYVGTIGIGIWSWRTGRFRLDRVPVDARDEAARRRAWMRSHRGRLVAMTAAFTFLMLVWVLAVVLITRPA
jgi:hypothetical protein